MPEIIVKEKIEEIKKANESTVLVDIRDRETYYDTHIPGSINIPFDEHFEADIRRAIAHHDTPIIVYGKNRDSSLPERAAHKLEDMGFKKVYDYSAGEEDWNQSKKSA